jgi:hypothetical protein
MAIMRAAKAYFIGLTLELSGAEGVRLEMLGVVVI